MLYLSVQCLHSVFFIADDSEDCDKVRRGDPTLTIPQMVDPHPLPLPLPMNGFAHSHNGKANGYVPHTINITNNPLAEPHQDKVPKCLVGCY